MFGQKWDQFKKSSALRCGIWSVAACVIISSGFQLWQCYEKSHHTQVSFEKLVLEKQQAIRNRTEAQQQAQAEHERLERIKERETHDAIAQEERLKWVHVIEAATAAMQAQKKQASIPVLQVSKRHELIDPNQLESDVPVNKEDAEFWSMKRLSSVKIPMVEQKKWCRNPIDRFILAALEEKGLSPNSAANRQVLARRLYFDMIGLPPTPEKIDQFIESKEQHAYEQLTEELLNNSGFGERWGRIWLDLARYADSNGYEEDELRPQAYPYRDFVIWAMNVDLPFNEFTKWQIAGDELAPQNPMGVAATGFFTAATLNTFIPQESERFDELDDMISTMSSAMMGLTVGCARCHDHMYDPISTSEYYGLVAIFSQTSRKHSYLTPDEGKEYRLLFDPVDERREELKQMQFARIKEDNISKLDYFTEEEKDLLRQPIDPSNEEQERLISLCERCLLITDEHLDDDFDPLPEDQQRYDQLMSELEKLEEQLPPSPPVGLTLSGSEISTTHILAGGDLNRKEEQVGPGFLSAVTTKHSDWNNNDWKKWANPTGDDIPKSRSALAHWMTDVEHGAGALIARVIVNRLWQHHMGHGLVRSSNDFGNEGDLPSHPELLEWLANELIQNNWSLKHIHRLIVNSATYRQSTDLNELKRQLDPENRLLGRHVPQRITAEMMRDTMLMTAGNLNTNMYGPGVKPPIPRDAVYNTQKDAEETWPCDFEADRPALWRRSIYVMLKRTVPVPILNLFDAPDGSFSCHERKTTTVPTQALALQNSTFVIEQSNRLAERVLNATNSQNEQIQLLFRLTFSRNPSNREIEATINFLQQNVDNNNSSMQKQRLAELCHVLYMSNEFFYID